MFSGGDYSEVARWLENFVSSHAKREDPRAEAALDDQGAREGVGYGVRVRLGGKLSPEIDLSYAEVARSRGSLRWCEQLAERVRALARDIAVAERRLPRPA
jgi:hypothetical protein